MSRSARVTAGALAVFAVALGALVGCSSNPSPASSSAPPSASASAPGTAAVGAAWLDAGKGTAVVSMGSSTCPPKAGDASASGQTVTVEFSLPTGKTACTADYAPRASYVALPAGVDPTKEVEIVAKGALSGTVKLAALPSMPAAGGENAPSAGWIEGAGSGSELPNGSFAFATWGSSTCPPSVGSVTATGAAAVVVQLTASAETACTMDMVPRAGLTAVPATVTGDAVKVAFLGAGAAGTADMLGTR
ncbi:hypothetical protein [Microbacterium rhizosphaerae]|uniref:DUF4232 domain-containing protein n=1 Tax=Microbacterium rhizosphaerae TaxID=1678237 RepID=A0ABZ0SMN0_9MICO|nr:hypothetical protein [Microbacterium rhizosphaerae]WPR89745.1 hypothetical protein SM116_00205 [Microbacterium rhizosphaerae]